MRQKFYFYALFFLLSIISGKTFAQYTIQVEGYVKDSETNEPLPYVNATIRGTSFGSITLTNGYYSITSKSDSSVLVFSYIGYETVSVPLKKGRNTINISLKPDSYLLDEVVVTRRERYSRRENPAVEFVRKMIELRDQNKPEEYDYFSYNTYEQRTFAYDDFDVEKARQNWIYKKVDFIFDYVDSTSVRGRTILPLYNEEIIEDYFYRKAPKAERKVVKGYKRAGVIDIISEDGIKQFIDEAFQDVDIFQDNVQLCLNRFVSPLSSIGPVYYKYYLLDTLDIDGEKCLNLGFAPFNSESFGFVGHLYVTLDSTYFVKKVELNVPRDINLNFISEMSIHQDYIRTEDGTRILTKNDIAMIFSITKKSKGSYARRVALYRDRKSVV